MARFVVLKRGGSIERVAINVDLVTDVHSTPGKFTDIFCGGRQIAVEGTFEHIVAQLSGEKVEGPKQAFRTI